MMEKLLTSKEVCDIFKISLPTLSRWLADGHFPPPRKIYSHSGNRWPKSQIEEVFETMPVATYKKSEHRESQYA